MPADELLATLMRNFYIDLDTFNEVVGLPGSPTDWRNLDSLFDPHASRDATESTARNSP